VLYIRRSLAWIHAIVFGHVSEFQHIRVKTNLEAARMCTWSYTMHLIAGISSLEIGRRYWRRSL
jgi:hypothetical protein